jgi:hypothetical protein
VEVGGKAVVVEVRVAVVMVLILFMCSHLWGEEEEEGREKHTQYVFSNEDEN